MKRLFTFLTMFLVSLAVLNAQTAVVPCGGELTGPGGTASFTVGQIDYLFKDKNALNIQQPYSVWEGVQQVYPVLDKVYDTICPGDYYAQYGFNLGPFNNPGTIMDTIFVASIVNAMNDTNIHIIGPDTIRVLYLTVRTPHTSVPQGRYIDVLAGNSIPNIYTHILGNGADSATMVVSPANPEITNVFIGSSFMYGNAPLTQSGTFYVTYTTVGSGCPISFTDTIHVADSLLCSITSITNDNSCGSGFGAATVVATGGSGNYSYAWVPTSPTQTTSTASNLTAGTYVVTITDLDMGYTVSATAIVGIDSFIANLSLADTQLCPGQSTTIQVSLVGGNSAYLDYEIFKLGQNSPFATDYGSSVPYYSTTVSPVGNEGDVISYYVKVVDWDYCEAYDTVSLVLACEGAPSASNTVSPAPDNGVIHYDDNLQIVVYNPVPGANVDTSCPLQYSINGGPWITWSNPSVPVLINGNDVFVGQVTFDLKHSDSCSTGKITNYSWTIAPAAGSISYIRDVQDFMVCLAHDSVRLTDIVVSGYDSTINKFQWMYEYALQNNIQHQSVWSDISVLGNPIVPYITPYVPVNANIGGYQTQSGDTIRIYVNLMQTNDGGVTWTISKSVIAEWIIRDNPTFDLATLQNDTVCANQVQLFTAGSSEQGTMGWNYGVGINYSNVQSVTGVIPYFNYSITSINGSTLSLSDFNNIDSLMTVFYLTPNNTSCPTIYDTAYLQILQLDTLTLVSDSATLSQEFCIGGALTDITYKWSGGATTANVTWNPSLPTGVTVTTNGDSLVIHGTPVVSGTYRYSVMTDGSCSHGTGSGSFTVNDLPTFSLHVTNAGCKGEPDGSIGIDLGTLLGIESDYTYSWTDSNSSIVGNQSQLNNVLAGTYTVEVTTNATGCTASLSGVVTEPATLVAATLSKLDVNCYGDASGMISITANGGNAPYDFYIYDINDSATVVKGFQSVPANTVKTSTGLTASSYIVYVNDANQCLFTDTITINEPTQLVVSVASQQNVSCYESEDGILKVSVTGGKPGYTYLWSNGQTTDSISALSPGAYTVSVTDLNACVATVSAVITRPAKITSEFYDSACNTYPWNGISYTSSGVYSQHLQTAGGCDSVVTLHLTIYKTSYATVNETACEQYTWPLNGTTYYQSGNYYDTLVNANGCDSIVTLHLTINNVAVYDISHVAVMSYTWAQNGVTYTTSGVYADTLVGQAANGCDSIINLHLTVTANTLSLQTSVTNATCYGNNSGAIAITVSGGVEPYSIYVYENSDINMAVKAFAGVLAGVQKNATGLPAGTYVVYVYDSLNSVITSNLLTINEPAPITYTFADTACVSYVWEGVTYNQSQQIVKVLKTSDGCDSTVTLNLFIKPGYTTTIYDTICYGTVYNQNGFNDSISGLHTLHLTSSDLCDSVVNLYLYVEPSFSVDLYDEVCQSTPYNNHGFFVSSLKNKNPGTYEYVQNYQSVSGCDSIVKLHLTVNPNVSITVYDNVCHGDVYIGMGFAIRTEDSIPKTYTYIQNLQTSKGCDSVITLKLTVNPDYNIDIYDTICAGDVYNNNGFSGISTAGVHTLNLQTVANGCDSIVNLHLEIVSPKYGDVYVTDCKTSYYWSLSGQTYNTSGDYTYTISGGASNGCDSVVTLHLTIPSQLLAVSVSGTNSVCNGGFGSISMTGTGGTAPYTMYVYDISDTNSALKAFSGVGANVAKNATGLASGTYFVEVYDVNGCSVTSTQVTLTEPAAITNSFTVTDCDSYTWGTVTYTQSGTYTQKFTSAKGCDSTVTLNLTINLTKYADVYVTDCKTSYYWSLSGQTYNSSGDYTYTISGGAANGCDSVVTLHLTIPNVLLNVSTSVTNVLCNGASTGAINVTTVGGTSPYSVDVYNTNDLTVTLVSFNNVGANKTVNNLPAATYMVKVTDANGCTATTTAIITEKTAVTLSLNSTLPSCYGESDATASVSVSGGTAPYTYNWSNGQVAANINGLSAGYYAVTVSDANNCSTSTGVTIAQPAKITHTYSQTECDKYVWNGITYTSTGVYSQTLQAANGCDSLVTVNLTITKSTEEHIYIQKCVAYTWFGNDLMTSGDYDTTITNSVGCDSVIHLHLTINQPTESHTTLTHCGPYYWNNQLRTTSGDYFYDTVNVNGCDSTAWLHLTIVSPTDSDLYVTECVSYTWLQNGVTYTQSGDYVDTLYGGNSVGCDSVVTLHLIINQPSVGEDSIVECISYVWPLNGKTYNVSGDYVDTIVGGNSVGCDSVVTLHLTINQPTDSNIYETACVEYRWELTSETYTETGDYEYVIVGGNSVGCDSTIILHLTINQPSVETFTVITNQPYHWDVTDNTYEVSGEYSHTYYGGAANGCDSTIILKLISTVGIDDAASEPEGLNALVYPNPTNDYINIVFDEELDIKEARCYDMYGKLVKVQKIESNETQMDMSVFANGVYVLRLNDGRDVVKTFKVVKH